MDQELLERMTEVYMTDPTCKAAVERLAASEGLSLVEAARRVAPKVAPAPHRAEAHDARYLLAPEAEREDLDLVAADLKGYYGDPQNAEDFAVSAAAQAERARAAEEAREEIGPMPPHPDEALDDRKRYEGTAELTAEEYAALPENLPFREHQSCGQICKVMTDLALRWEADKRVPVRPPVMHIRPTGLDGAMRVKVVVDTVPARRRRALVLTGFASEHDVLDGQIAEIADLATEDPALRLVVRRDPSQNWATGMVYTVTCGHDHSQDLPVGIGEMEEVPDFVREFLSAILGIDLESTPGMVVLSIPGFSESVSGGEDENGPEA